jgi:hypothetical protein
MIALSVRRERRTRTMRRAAVLTAIAALAVTLILAGFVGATCPGVDHTRVRLADWVYDEFYEEGTTTPLTVELTISVVSPGTEVYYYDGSWHPVTESATVFGSKTKYSKGGAVRIAYRYGDCGGELQPHDD